MIQIKKLSHLHESRFMLRIRSKLFIYLHKAKKTRIQQLQKLERALVRVDYQMLSNAKRHLLR